MFFFFGFDFEHFFENGVQGRFGLTVKSFNHLQIINKMFEIY